MSISVQVQESPAAWEQPPVTPFNEAAWQAWEAEGVKDDRRSNAIRLKALKWASIAVLFTTAVLGARLVTPYDIGARFIVAIAATVLFFNALGARNYVYSALFAGLALLYNPVFPVFEFAGEWQRALLLISAAPFVASLALLGYGRHNKA